MSSLATSFKGQTKKSRFISLLERVAEWDSALANRKLGLRVQVSPLDASGKSVSQVGKIIPGALSSGRPYADSV